MGRIYFLVALFMPALKEENISNNSVRQYYTPGFN